MSCYSGCTVKVIKKLVLWTFHNVKYDCKQIKIHDVPLLEIYH